MQAVQAVAAPAQQTKPEQHTTHKLTIDKSTQKPRVVILGSGWGAVSLLKQLPKHIRLSKCIWPYQNSWSLCSYHTLHDVRGRQGSDPQLYSALHAMCCSNDYDIVVLSPRNYFLFTALLPQVASGNLEQHSIIESMRKIIGPKVLSTSSQYPVWKHITTHQAIVILWFCREDTLKQQSQTSTPSNRPSLQTFQSMLVLSSMTLRCPTTSLCTRLDQLSTHLALR